MKLILILPILILTLLVGTPAFSADFQKGLTALESGDFATALREWKPLAKQGDAGTFADLAGIDKKLGLPKGTSWEMGGFADYFAFEEN
mgnify:CR=1 FL=1